MEDKSMDSKQNLINEKADLDEKLRRLIAHKYTGAFETLPADEQERLNTQGHFMCAYSAILSARIEALIS